MCAHTLTHAHIHTHTWHTYTHILETRTFAHTRWLCFGAKHIIHKKSHAVKLTIVSGKSQHTTYLQCLSYEAYNFMYIFIADNYIGNNVWSPNVYKKHSQSRNGINFLINSKLSLYTLLNCSNTINIHGGFV